MAFPYGRSNGPRRPSVTDGSHRRKAGRRPIAAPRLQVEHQALIGQPGSHHHQRIGRDIYLEAGEGVGESHPIGTRPDYRGRQQQLHPQLQQTPLDAVLFERIDRPLRDYGRGRHQHHLISLANQQFGQHSTQVVVVVVV